MNINSVMIAAPSSNSGKTTVAVGIMLALKNLGYNVQPFKVGPDYIDPGFHTYVTGNKSRNLDTVMGNNDIIKEIFIKNSTGKDISIVEGVMGLFDGKSVNSIKGSSFEISLLLNIPVILVIDISAMARSATAIIHGFKNIDKRINLKGVILNRAGSDYHCRIVKEAIEKINKVKVLGCIKNNNDLKINSRHLGLIPFIEDKLNNNYFDKLNETINKSIDLNEIIKISKNKGNIKIKKMKIYNYISENKVKIGIAYNKAFNFYYEENLDLLKKYGAEIIYFDPIRDEKLPDVDGIYIGGGFPEVYASELSENKSMLSDIKNKIENYMPVFAECGGYMYLCSNINYNKKTYNMVNSIPANVYMDRLTIGYKTVESNDNNYLLKNNYKIKGHEFHYSILEYIKENNKPYKLNGKTDGYAYKNMIAGYVHMYFPSNQKIPENFVKKCYEYKYNRKNII